MPTSISTATGNDLFDTIFATPLSPSAPTSVTPAPTTEPTVTVTEIPSTPNARLLSDDEIQDTVFGKSEPANVTTPAPVTPTPVAVEKGTDKPTPPTEPVLTEPSGDEEAEYTKQVFKNAAERLIKKGYWKEVDDFDKLEFDEDTYQEFAEFQAQQAIEEAWQSVKQTNDVVNGILSVIEAGGNPDQIIDLFKEQQKLTQIDTSTPEGKLELIGKFYEDIVGATPAQAKAKLKKLEVGDESDLQSEFELAETKYNEHFQNEQKRIQDAEKQRVQQEQNRITQARQKMQEELSKQSVHPSTSKKLIDSIYNPAYKLQDGSTISELDYQIEKIRRNPSELLDLARFIMDKEAYIKAQTTATANKTVDQVFGKLKFTPKKSPTTTSQSPTPRSTATPVVKDLYSSLIS